MTMLTKRLRALHDDDRGATLLELVVGMTIMVIFMGMFTGAMLMMSSTTNKVEAVSNSATQVTDSFLELDKSVRYASGISAVTPAVGSNDWHVEFERTISGVDTCTQLRTNHTKGTLEWRTWSPNSTGSGYTNLTAWLPLATSVTNYAVGASPAPFAVPATSTNSSFQQLTISVVAASGTNTSAVTQNSMTFTALNSSVGSSASVCQQVSVGQTS
jgi:hypothetical protein